jgi:hypothetical protein
MNHAVNADDFLSEFMHQGIPTQDELNRRELTMCDFGAELGNEENDVPLYDQYNRGLVATQQDRPRTNLALEGNECPVNVPMKANRPGVTGYIPSMEEAVEMGAIPLPKGLGRKGY